MKHQPVKLKKTDRYRYITQIFFKKYCGYKKLILYLNKETKKMKEGSKKEESLDKKQMMKKGGKKC